MSFSDANDTVSDAELIRRAQASHADFALLVDRYSTRLYAFVKRLYYFEHEDIQDILQEAFIKLYRNLNAYDPSFAVSTWIYQITRNCAIDALRKKRVRPLTMALEDEEWEHLRVGAAEGMSDVMHLEELKRAIMNLPLKYREPFTLLYLEEKTYEEMVDILKQPKGTIASLIHRAKGLLQQQLKHASLL